MRTALELRLPTPSWTPRHDHAARAGKHNATRRPRAGRILAECIVSLGVLAVGVTVSLTLSRASLVLSDDARLMNELAATAGAHAERATVDACTGASTGGQVTSPRVQLTFVDAISATGPQATRQRHVAATVQFSPLANRDSSSFAIDAAGVCPW